MAGELDRADILKLIGGGLIALAVLLVLPWAGSGSGSGHEPGVDAVRTLSLRDHAWIAAAIAASVGLCFLVLSKAVGRARPSRSATQQPITGDPNDGRGRREQWEDEPLDELPSDTDWARSLAAALRRHAEQPDAESLGSLSRLTGREGAASEIELEARRLLWLARRETESPQLAAATAAFEESKRAKQ